MQKNNYLVYFLVALLVGGAFYIGSVNSRITSLEKTVQEGGSPTTNSAPTVAAFKESDLSTIAKNIGLNVTDFAANLKSAEIIKEVQDQEASGKKAGVTGTPGVFLLDNQTGNIAVAPGAVPFDMLKAMADKLLAGLTDADKTTDPATGIEYTDKTKLTLDPISGTDYVRGDTNARITLVEYSDYECPYCKRFDPTAKQLLQAYPTQVNWVYRQFPLDNLHPAARIKAQAARTAGKLGGADAFWKYSDVLVTE